jgi:hypothetical protein
VLLLLVDLLLWYLLLLVPLLWGEEGREGESIQWKKEAGACVISVGVDLVWLLAIVWHLCGCWRKGACCTGHICYIPWGFS